MLVHHFVNHVWKYNTYYGPHTVAAYFGESFAPLAPLNNTSQPTISITASVYGWEKNTDFFYPGAGPGGKIADGETVQKGMSLKFREDFSKLSIITHVYCDIDGKDYSNYCDKPGVWLSSIVNDAIPTNNMDTGWHNYNVYAATQNGTTNTATFRFQLTEVPQIAITEAYAYAGNRS